MEAIMGLLIVIVFILSGVLLATTRYSEMLVGKIVGKYKGDEYRGGFLVVEIEKPYVTELGTKEIRKHQITYKVPEEYYNEKNIGDKGVFPF